MGKTTYFLTVILYAILQCTNSLSCKADDVPGKEFLLYQDTLKTYFERLSTERHDAIREEINIKILDAFGKVLQLENSFDFDFNQLKNIGVLKSDDNKLKIIQWNVPYNDRTHQYFGFIQLKKTSKNILLFELHDNSDAIKSPQTAILNHTNWYGALYYKIIENKYKGEKYYTLLGSDLNDLFTKKKIVEILSFDQDDNPVFGASVFKNRKGNETRLIFEYSSQASMTLTYDSEKEMIIYDHLSPSRPSLKGNYEFYGPDFSYDGLKFERGIWNSYPDIDVRNLTLD